MKLEYVDSLILSHPFTKGFEQVSHCISREEVCQVAQGQISEAIAKRKKVDIEGIEDGSTVCSTTFYIGLLVEPKPSTLAIPPSVPEYRSDILLKLALLVHENWIYHTPLQNLQSWSRCGKSTTSLKWVSLFETSKGISRKGAVWDARSSHARSSFSSALPDYVFDEGERQPRQALKRPKTGKVRAILSLVTLLALDLVITTYRVT